MLIVVIISIKLKFLSDFKYCNFRYSRKFEFNFEFEFIMITSIDLTIVDNLINICITYYFILISVINLLTVDFYNIHFRCKFEFQLKLELLLNLFVILFEDIKILIIFVIIIRLKIYNISIVIKEVEN